MKMKNWKTSLTGILAGVCYIGFKLLAGHPVTGEDISLALGLAGIGLIAKDHNVSGGK